MHRFSRKAGEQAAGGSGAQAPIVLYHAGMAGQTELVAGWTGAADGPASQPAPGS